MAKNAESIKALSSTTSTQAGNLGGVKAVAQKRFEDVVVESRSGTVGKGTSYITTKTRSTIDQQGAIVSTGVNSDIAIEGNGMYVVADSANDERVFTRKGDFRQDELGFWKNGANKMLMAWKIDDEGNIPQNSSLLSSLEAVNFANTKGDPKATTAISISMNLNADQEEIRGPGPIFKMQRSGLNSTTGLTNPKDLLIPEITSSGGLQLGDTFVMTSTPPGVPKTIEFGGMSIGRAPTTARPIYNATNSTTEFSTIPAGSTLKITVGGATSQTYTFTFKAGSPNTSDKEFNNMTTLSAAINKISALNSRLDRNGNIHIGTADPDVSLQFVDGNGSELSKHLGLYNVAAAQNGTKRFNSLATLQQAVNANQSSIELKAKITNGAIDITSLNATSNFQMTTTSEGIHRIRHATLGDNTEKGRATVTITAPNNGLKTTGGDYVKLVNTGNPRLPDGIYYVSSANEQGFTVNILANNPSAAAAGGGAIGGIADGFPAAQVARDIINSPDEANSPTWKKVAGKSEPTLAGTVGAYAGGAPNNLNVTVPGAHGIVVNDVVYISGGTVAAAGGTAVNVPDGYYRVTAVVGNDITINVPVSPGPAPAGTPNTLSVTKIGNTVNAGDFNAGINTKVFETFVAAPNNNIVRVYLPNNNYSKDDFIAFNNLPDAYAIGGATIKNNFKYKVVNSAADYVDIEALDAADAALAGPLVNASGNYATAAPAATDVGFNFSINYFSRTLEYLNSSPNQPETETRSLDDLFVKSYDKDNAEKSLSSGTFGTNKVFTQTIQGYDSLGSKYNLLVHFAKLQDGLWAVEVASIFDNATGEFNIVNTNNRTDGYIQGGTISFDNDGNFLQAEGVDQPITFNTGNGSADVNLTIDWINQLGTIKNGTVTQYARDNNFEFVQQNGRAAGVLTNVTVTEEGIIVGTYDSGETRDLYRIPIATFPNINGLVPGEGGTYRVSRESGELLLKTAGSNGAGKTVGGALEASNTDTTSELLTIKDTSLAIQANARVVGVQIQDQKTILAETQ